MKWLDGITELMDMNLSKLRETVKDREAWRAAVHEISELDITKRLNNNRCVYCDYIYFDIYGCVHTYESCIHASALFAIAENPRIK